MKNIKDFNNFFQDINEAEKGLMHKLLNVPEDDKIASKYKSGEKLAHDLIKAIKKSKIVPNADVKKKASSMLAYAANWPSDGKNSVLDKALRAIKTVDEENMNLDN